MSFYPGQVPGQVSYACFLLRICMSPPPHMQVALQSNSAALIAAQGAAAQLVAQRQASAQAAAAQAAAAAAITNMATPKVTKPLH